MLFSSTIFIFLFLPVVSFLYFIVREKFRNAVLLLASLLFYAYGEPKFIFVLLASMAVNYLFALGLDKLSAVQRPKMRKSVFIAGVAVNVFILFICKYLSGNFLSGGCIQKGSRGTEKSDQSCFIYFFLPAAYCRTDRAVQNDGGGTGVKAGKLGGHYLRRQKVFNRARKESDSVE